MGRACRAICGRCGAQATVLIAGGRVGISTWTGPPPEAPPPEDVPQFPTDQLPADQFPPGFPFDD